MKTKLMGLCLAVALASVAVAAAPTLQPKANDVWVMAGDSITAQRLHSNYIEAYYRTRYPELNLRFRNSGVGGDVTRRVLDRFDYDVAAFGPTIVSVELGMNDVGQGDDPAQYIDGMREIIARIRAIPAQPILISSSPVNDGSMPGGWMSTHNRRLGLYTDALKRLGEREGVLVVDQFHPLLAVWGRNKAMENLSRMVAQADDLAHTPGFSAATEFLAFARAWKQSGYAPVSLGDDPVHPGPVGQYMMAAAILLGLSAERDSSVATLKWDGRIVAQEHCRISGVTVKDGVLSFTRRDELRPWPLLRPAREAMRLMPEIADLSGSVLRVGDLPEDRYHMVVNGSHVAELTAAELAAGWNMTLASAGVIAERGTAIMTDIDALQAHVSRTWRAASRARDQARLAETEKAIANLETRLGAACKPPAPIRIEIRPVSRVRSLM